MRKKNSTYFINFLIHHAHTLEWLRFADAPVLVVYTEEKRYMIGLGKYVLPDDSVFFSLDVNDNEKENNQSVEFRDKNEQFDRLEKLYKIGSDRAKWIHKDVKLRK